MQNDWMRDLSAKIKAKADAKVSAAAVSAEVSADLCRQRGPGRPASVMKHAEIFLTSDGGTGSGNEFKIKDPARARRATQHLALVRTRSAPHGMVGGRPRCPLAALGKAESIRTIAQHIRNTGSEFSIGNGRGHSA